VTGDRHVLHVECVAADDGWACAVAVGDDAGATRHRVRVGAGDLERLAPGTDRPERLVEASFEFLLEREPRTSILRAFDLTEIGRYFPEYEREIRRR
jgi:hypothetical protein